MTAREVEAAGELASARAIETVRVGALAAAVKARRSGTSGLMTAQTHGQTERRARPKPDSPAAVEPLWCSVTATAAAAAAADAE